MARNSLNTNQMDYVLANDLAHISAEQHLAYLLDKTKAYKAQTKAEIADLILRRWLTMTKNILLAVSGSISAYKAADLSHQLTKLGYNVSVLMTKAAAQFITPLTLQVLSKTPST